MARRCGTCPRYQRRSGAGAGFSLIELLFVIGIVVLLVALIFPVFRSLRESNQLMSCTSRLQRLGQALRIYYLDEHGVPPYYLDPMTATGDVDTTTPIGTGLKGLLANDYVSDKNLFHCPRAVDVKPADANYYDSYEERDALAQTDTTMYGKANQFKYMSVRGVLDTDPDFKRQLTKCRPPDSALSETLNAPTLDRNWQPDDTTIITWCDYHADTYERGGEGQYNVLFWDGSVICRPLSRMRSTPPDAAWRVGQHD